MVVFNIRQTGNELLKILERELRPKNIVRLTVDVLIPEVIRGDKQGLCKSILSICKYLDNSVLDLLVDIEFLRLARYSESIILNIDVKGSAPGSLAMPTLHALDTLVSRLPYNTTYSNSAKSVRFVFRMTFQCAPEHSPFGQFVNKHILLAEDNEVSALVLISFLEEWGFIVRRVANGHAAVAEAMEHRFDMIFMDIHMPGISGYEAIREIRGFNSTVPIIAVSTSSIKDEAQAKEAGATSIITKPVSSEDLRQTLARHLIRKMP